MRLKLSRGTLAGASAAFVAGCQFPTPPNRDLPPDATRVCEPASHVCAASVAPHCSHAGPSSTTETCTFGCAATGDRCADLDPSNGLAAQLDEARSADPLILTGDAVIDTTAGTIINGDGTNLLVRSTMITGGPVEILAISVGSLQVHNVTVRGARALAILSHGDVTITGHFSASANREVPGPGAIVDAMAACAGKRGGFDVSARNYGGGGGGGHGTAGADGGRAFNLMPGAGGAPVGSAALQPLHGGCQGASISPFEWRGAGGGAVQLSTRGNVRLAVGAFLSANGGGASGGVTDVFECLPMVACYAGGGGGSGGSLLVEAAALILEANSGIVANGGSGHMGTLPPSAASDGLLSEEASPPFVPCAGTPCPRGGSGGARAALPVSGGPVTTGEGAGGGGAIGRTRINLPAAGQPQATSPILSPVPSISNVSIR